MNISSENMRTYRPRLAYYHPNARGTGSAVQFELHPAHDDTAGAVFAKFARQMSVGGSEGGVRRFATFDWQKAITVKLDINDLAHMLEVFRGMRENVADGKGLFHQSQSAMTVIRFEHRLEPVPGYALAVWRKSRATGPDEKLDVQVFFSEAEALALSGAIENSLGVIAFGIPMVIPHGVHGVLPQTEITQVDEAVDF